jgi:hypothetical protein
MGHSAKACYSEALILCLDKSSTLNLFFKVGFSQSDFLMEVLFVGSFILSHLGTTDSLTRQIPIE